MDLSLIGPVLAAAGGLVAAYTGWQARRDNRATSEKAQELADRAQESNELKIAWELYKERFSDQEKRIEGLAISNQNLLSQNQTILATNQEQQRVINGLRDEVAICDARNVRLEVRVKELEGMEARVEQLEEILREHGITHT